MQTTESTTRAASGTDLNRMQGLSNIQSAIISDVDLLKRIALHDASAFEIYFDRYAGRILGLLLRLLNDRAAADDVLQETFLQVWRTAATFDPERSGPLVWLSMIARSRARDHQRRDRRLQSLQLVALNAQGDISTGDVPSEAAEYVESSRAARGVLSSLPDDQQSVIRLAYYGGLSHSEIAERLALPLGTIKTRIRLGIRRMREILDGQRKVSA